MFTTLGTSRYDYRECLARLRHDVPSLHRVVVLEDTSGVYPATGPSPFFIDFASLLETGRSQNVNWRELEKPISDSDVLNLQFTSGSTGAPKAAALTHHGMINCARYIGMNMNISKEDKVVVPVPLFHAFGLIIGTVLSKFQLINFLTAA